MVRDGLTLVPAFQGAARECLRQAGERGRFAPPPKTPHAGCPRSAGFYVRWQYQRTPRRKTPRRRPAAARGDSRERLPPSVSSLPGPARKMGVVSSYLYNFLAACGNSTKSPSPPFEAARPCGFQSILRKPCASGLPCGFAVLTPARIVAVVVLSSLAALMLALRSLNAPERRGRFCAVLNSRRKFAPMRAARSAATASHSSGSGCGW